MVDCRPFLLGKDCHSSAVGAQLAGQNRQLFDWLSSFLASIKHIKQAALANHLLRHM
jgi:hypothetical protein